MVVEELVGVVEAQGVARFISEMQAAAAATQAASLSLAANSQALAMAGVAAQASAMRQSQAATLAEGGYVNLAGAASHLADVLDTTGAKYSPTRVVDLGNAAAATGRQFAVVGDKVGLFGFVLRAANLVNYSGQYGHLGKNLLVVAQGAGRLVYAMDAVRRTLFGTIAPLRLLEGVVKSLVLPALDAAASQMQRSADAATRRFGGALMKLRSDLSSVGAASQTMARQLLGLPLYMVAKGLHAIVSPAAAAGSSIVLAATRGVRALAGLLTATEQAAAAQRRMAQSTASVAAINAVGTAANRSRNFLLGLAAAGGVVASGGFAAAAGFRAAADMESTRTAFGVLLRDVEKGNRLFAEVAAFSDATPFQALELKGAAQQLLAVNVSAQQIVPTMQVLGDLAAAAKIPIGDMASLYAKAMSQGIVQADLLNSLTERRIPILETLAQQLGTNAMGVRAMAEAGTLTFPKLQRAMVALTADGAQFGGMMATQSATLAGLWSTVSSKVTTALGGVAQAFVDAFDIKAGMQSAAHWLDWFNTEGVKGAAAWMKSVAAPVVASVQWVAGAFQTYWPYIAEISAAVWNGIAAVVSSVWSSVMEVGKLAFGWIASAFDGNAADSRNWAADLRVAFAAVEFGMNHFGDIWKVIGGEVALGAVQVYNTVVYWFNAVMAYIDYFVRDFVGTFTGMAKFAVTVFDNIGTNAKLLFEGIMSWIQGDGFNVEWVGLTEGFKHTVEALPEIAARQAGPIEAALMADVQRLRDKLGTEFNAAIARGGVALPAADARASQVPTLPDMPAARKPDALQIGKEPDMPGQKGKGAPANRSAQLVETMFQGSKESLQTILRGRDGAGEQTAAKIAERQRREQLAEQRKAAAALWQIQKDMAKAGPKADGMNVKLVMMGAA